MVPQNIILSIIISIFLILIVFELVRRQKLNEEYSWLWMLSGWIILLLTIYPPFLKFVTWIIGAVVPASALIFCGVMFLLLICLHFSVKISTITNRMKKIAQEYAIMEAKIEEISKQMEK